MTTETEARYDALETMPSEDRDARQFERLRHILSIAKERAPTHRARLADVDPAAITDRAALAGLPVLRKSDLTALQSETPPFGGLTTAPLSAFRQVFMSPGPIFEPGSDALDWWRIGRAMFAAGLRKGDLLHNAFAYHLTPAGAMFENAARAVGATVLAGGVGQTEQQVTAMAAARPTAYGGTPDFLKVLLDKADELGRDLSSLKIALVSGGALFPSLRQGYADRGIATLQCYATADVGLIAYETAANGRPNDGMIVDEGVILEIVRPGTSDPTPMGEVGEVVVTALTPDYPLIRFATGDLSTMTPGQSPCGRTGPRIKGWMGRADQRTKIKGMFVDPAQVAAVLRAHPEIAKARLVVRRDGDQDVYELKLETAETDPALAERVAATAAAEFKLRGAATLSPIGALPNDGKVIDDARDYDA